MIIDKLTKAFETRSDKPNENWYNDDRLVIDETTVEGRALAEKIINNYPYFDLIVENNEVTNIVVYPQINYTVDKTQVTIDEIVTITVEHEVIAVIEDTEYTVTDSVIEFSHYKEGTYNITLKADGYKPTTITIEVINNEATV
jgi:hypothetical protein